MNGNRTGIKGKGRMAVFAGQFYPNDEGLLRKAVNGFLEKAKKVGVEGKLKALIVPHAGYVYSGIVAATGYNLLRNSSFKRVVILGPSHTAFFHGAALSSADFWETPLGKVKVEKVKSFYFAELDEGHENEHSIEVQIPFLQAVLRDFSIIPISIGDAGAQEVSDALIPLIDRFTILIVSSDLSHYYPYSEAVKVDGFANELIPKLDVKGVEGKVEACGKIGILAVMHLAKRLKWRCKKLEYKNSGDIMGNKEEVVGYGCYAFFS